ncbi:lasso peptide biosynthesis PqqD family chaperone [Streptomyces iconiensis]|uniref:Lasso peptide biosynthesis PqqD family chaperone n=1 Tax=Streptomyces iconiensis TaxID=1384038 RepID=A0ABT7A0L4_9ACTN|nr:lasso peptide biosynthesis PqqD family chaperone [Streptomyces iconiensis]MDJ1134870.1 lasso peptide biosynthesis PqqD family chaperone [Streptomyces iconiensis]
MNITLADHVSVVPGEDGSSVVLDQRNGRYWQLNATGAMILRLLLRERNTRDTVRALVERHPTAAERIPGDVETLLATLRERGLVTV